MPLYSQDDGATFGWSSLEFDANKGKPGYKPPNPLKLPAPVPLNQKPTLADFKENGRYCKSGLAYPASDYLAVCTSFTEMMYYDATTKKTTKLKEVDGAYKCSPEDQANVCQLRFKIDPAYDEYTDATGTSRGYVENQCKCALDGGVDSGYCTSTLGTDKYRKAV